MLNRKVKGTKQGYCSNYAGVVATLINPVTADETLLLFEEWDNTGVQPPIYCHDKRKYCYADREC